MGQEPHEIVRCPLCGGRDIRQSLPRSILDSIMAVFQMKPFRCRSCRHRFFKRLPGGEKIGLAEEGESERRG